MNTIFELWSHDRWKPRTIIIEGFGGKRALGFLLKSELCQKRSKFRMQFCFLVSNNVLHVFSLKFASFLRYYACKKTHFSKGILWGPFVEWKTKETFCFAKQWSHHNTSNSYYCFVSTSGWGAERARFEFVLPWHRFDTRSLKFFFRSVPFLFPKMKISILKKCVYSGNLERIFYTGYCDVRQHVNFDRASKQREVMQYSSFD